MNQREKIVLKYMLIAALLCVCVINFSVLLSLFNRVLKAMNGVIYGAMFAYVINLLMVKFEFLYGKTKVPQKHIRALSLLSSVVILSLVLALFIIIVVPTLRDASAVLIEKGPQYLDRLTSSFQELIASENMIGQWLGESMPNAEKLIEELKTYLSNGIGNILNNTVGAVSSIISGLMNSVIALIISLYVLMDKERFQRIYHLILNYIFRSNKKTAAHCLHVVNQTFSSFIYGECVEALILATICSLGLFLMKMPYALMIGILVGTINMIPMVGAYIGGAIGAFLVFTVKPIQAVIFLVYLVIIQQIESNVFYPRVVGKSVGLPGVYVMMSVVVLGNLFGIPGMILGVPAVASIYKLLREYIDQYDSQSTINAI